MALLTHYSFYHDKILPFQHHLIQSTKFLTNHKQEVHIMNYFNIKLDAAFL